MSKWKTHGVGQNSSKTQGIEARVSELRKAGMKIVFGALGAALKPLGFRKVRYGFVRDRGAVSDHIGIQSLPPVPGHWEPSLVFSLVCLEFSIKATNTWEPGHYMNASIYYGANDFVPQLRPYRDIARIEEVSSYADDCVEATLGHILPLLERFKGGDDIAEFFLTEDPATVLIKRRLGYKDRQTWDSLVWTGQIDPAKEPFLDWLKARDESSRRRNARNAP